MCQQYPQCLEHRENRPITPYADSGTWLHGASRQQPSVPAPAYLQCLHQSSRGTSLSSVHRQFRPESPQSPSTSFAPSIAWLESRVESLGSEHVTTNHEGIACLSPNPEKDHLDHNSHSQDPLGLRIARDPEKAGVEYADTPSQGPQPHQITFVFTSTDMFRESSCTEEHAVWILVYLSLLSPLLALLIATYTLLVTPFLFLLAMPSLFTSQASFPIHLCIFLAPPLNLQLSLIFSSTYISDASRCDPTMLLLIHLLSPFYAVWIALSAWVAAVFWFYAAILGDPDGRDGKDDGRAAVLGVRGWWEQWLEMGKRAECMN